jgi:glycosyltransferase involved in cell wall biosynthesis
VREALRRRWRRGQKLALAGLDALTGGTVARAVEKRLWRRLERERRRTGAGAATDARRAAGVTRVAFVNTQGSPGGAAKVVSQLRDHLTATGIDAPLFARRREGPGTYGLDSGEGVLLEYACEAGGWLDLDHIGSFGLADHPVFRSADVVHLHNLHGGYFNFMALPRLCAGRPAVWTLHDMQAVTGHCAHSLDCERWRSGCGECPYPGLYPSVRKDRTAELWRLKRDAYADLDVVIVCPAQWLQARVRASPLMGHLRTEVIYNGVDTDVFFPVPDELRRQTRSRLGIRAEDRVLAFSAQGGVTNPWKGEPLLLQALRRLGKRENLVFLNIGGPAEYGSPVEGIRWVNTRHVSLEAEMRSLYGAADLFVYPSVADTCPLTVLEAMACGLPVAAFGTGGVPELVEAGETGWVAPQGDVAALAANLARLIDDPDLRRRMGRSAVARVKAHFGLPEMVRRYRELYDEVQNP